MDRREREELDRHITGDRGEDSVPAEKECPDGEPHDTHAWTGADLVNYDCPGVFVRLPRRLCPDDDTHDGHAWSGNAAGEDGTWWCRGTSFRDRYAGESNASFTKRFLGESRDV